jgi:hypothetical protein
MTLAPKRNSNGNSNRCPSQFKKPKALRIIGGRAVMSTKRVVLYAKRIKRKTLKTQVNQLKYNNVWVVSSYEDGRRSYGFAFTDYKEATKVFEKGQKDYPELKWLNTYFPLNVTERAKHQIELLKFRKEE